MRVVEPSSRGPQGCECNVGGFGMWGIEPTFSRTVECAVKSVRITLTHCSPLLCMIVE